MGAALGAELRRVGTSVVWASAGRSAATARRAELAGLSDVGTVAELARRSDVVISVCPPHAASETARSVAGYQGVYLDANAVAPATARAIAAEVEAGGGRFVDGGLVGPPPSVAATRLYLSGPASAFVAGLFHGTAVQARPLSDRFGDASALKLAYAAWTKGTAALVLAIRELAQAEEIEPALLAEWRESLPDLLGRSASAARSAAEKGWRWVGEMEEIASAFASAGLPDGFHRAAAEVFRRSPKPPQR
jgi:3-hydroxyisobutyrate dehydrogenase-like beta-hydroxyacid dehydrogenase